jgi:putative peptidoglycan binding protein
VPRKISIDDEAPRRRRGATAMADDAAADRGLIMRIFLRSPKDALAGAIAFAVVGAIFANALFLQPGRHPAPMFGSLTAMPAMASAPANPLPRPRPSDADAAEARIAESKAADLMANLVKTTGTTPAIPPVVARPSVSLGLSSHGEAVSAANARRVAAVQRALTEYGYGQLKPTGTVGSDTQAAIQKFERARRLPVTGQVSDRLVRELASTIGHSID